MSEEENKEEEKKDLPPEKEPEVVSEENASASTESIEPDESKPQMKVKESKAETKQKPSAKTEKEPKPDTSDSQEKSSTDDESGAEPKAEKKEETAEDLLGANIEQVKIRKAKGSKNITSGICFIVATFNNTKVSFSDMKGNVISWSSSGKCNFRGSRKSTAYAAQVVTQDAGRAAMSHGMKEVVVKVKGPGMGRDSAIRALQSLGFIVSTIIDVTPVPHNGCRPPKRRRV